MIFHYKIPLASSDGTRVIYQDIYFFREYCPSREDVISVLENKRGCASYDNGEDLYWRDCIKSVESVELFPYVNEYSPHCVSFTDVQLKDETIRAAVMLTISYDDVVCS